MVCRGIFLWSENGTHSDDSEIIQIINNIILFVLKVQNVGWLMTERNKANASRGAPSITGSPAGRAVAVLMASAVVVLNMKLQFFAKGTILHQLIFQIWRVGLR